MNVELLYKSWGCSETHICKFCRREFTDPEVLSIHLCGEVSFSNIPRSILELVCEEELVESWYLTS